LWRSLSRYQLDAGEVALLRQACSTLAELEQIEDELADAPMTVLGSKGQLTAHPLLAIADNKRKTLEMLIRALALPLLGEEVGAVRTPEQRRKAKQQLGIGLKGVSGGQGSA
jgi:hypothetical protein